MGLMCDCTALVSLLCFIVFIGSSCHFMTTLMSEEAKRAKGRNERKSEETRETKEGQQQSGEDKTTKRENDCWGKMKNKNERKKKENKDK